MKKTNASRWQYFPTFKLKEILDNDGMTDCGTAYDWAMWEVQGEYDRRMNLVSERESKALEKMWDSHAKESGELPPKLSVKIIKESIANAFSVVLPIPEFVGLPPVIDESIYNLPF